MKESFVQIPVKVRPRLPKGRFHKLLINSTNVHIKSWENLYGNSGSDTLLTFSQSDILDVRFKKPLSSAIEGKCYVTYSTKQLQEKKIIISAITPNGQFNNDLTDAVAASLEAVRHQRLFLPERPQIITLNPPSTAKKFFAGFSLFAGAMIFGGLSQGWGFPLFLGCFLFFPSLIALGIDYIRLHAAWPWYLKFLTYVIMFLVGFFLMAFSFFLIDSLGILRR